MKVLVIDAEELIRNVISEYISLEKYESYETSNGLEAIDIVENNNTAVIVLDILSIVKNILEVHKLPNSGGQ